MSLLDGFLAGTRLDLTPFGNNPQPSRAQPGYPARDLR